MFLLQKSHLQPFPPIFHFYTVTKLNFVYLKVIQACYSLICECNFKIIKYFWFDSFLVFFLAMVVQIVYLVPCSVLGGHFFHRKNKKKKARNKLLSISYLLYLFSTSPPTCHCSNSHGSNKSFKRVLIVTLKAKSR